ncbi:hypothetical protein [Peribacillus sp. SCS-155]|uniref:hypothetical protein n=1 Tax=Peribacillus sedimenti TaxID=3115297 RepID=UPI003905C59B
MKKERAALANGQMKIAGIRLMIYEILLLLVIQSYKLPWLYGPYAHSFQFSTAPTPLYPFS